MKSKYLKTDGFNIHYLEGGSGEVVILLSSLGITSKSYQQLGERLAEKYKVFIPNLGEGSSSGERLIMSLGEYVSLFNDFLKAAKIDKFYLVAFSFGGLVACKYYKRYPSRIKALFLTSTTLVPIKGRLLLKGYPYLLFKNLFSKKGLKVNLLWLSDGLASFIKQPRQVLENFLIGFNNLGEALTELKIPNLLVLADKDEFIPSSTIKEMKNIKGVNLEVIKGGHGWFFLEPEKFLVKVEKFLKENHQTSSNFIHDGEQISDRILM